MEREKNNLQAKLLDHQKLIELNESYKIEIAKISEINNSLTH